MFQIRLPEDFYDNLHPLEIDYSLKNIQKNTVLTGIERSKVKI